MADYLVVSLSVQHMQEGTPTVALLGLLEVRLVAACCEVAVGWS